MSISPNSPTLLSQWQMTKYVNAASLAIWVCDYCISFEVEVRLVWGRKWDFTRTLFSLTRYLTFLGAIVGIYSIEEVRTEDCGSLENASNTLQTMGVICAEGLLTLRIYAFWTRSKKTIIIWLCVYAVVSIAGTITVYTMLQPYEDYSSSEGCIFLEEKSTAILYAFLAVYECMLLLLTLMKTTSYPRSPIFATLYRDSVFYMISIIGVSVVNIIVHVTLPIGYSSTMDIMQMVLHSCLASRILFNLRECDNCRHNDDGPLVALSVMQFEAGEAITISSDVD